MDIKLEYNVIETQETNHNVILGLSRGAWINRIEWQIKGKKLHLYEVQNT